MVALKTERQVFMWHVEPLPNPKNVPKAVSLGEIIQALKSSWEADESRIYIGVDGKIVSQEEAQEVGLKNCVYIADFQENKSNGTVTLLINRGDPDAVDPSYLNLGSGEKAVRPVGPENDDEVQGWSAHLVISTVKKRGNGYRACFERMPNVSSTLVDRLFQAILDRHTSGDPKYVYPKAIKQGKKTRVEEKPYKIRLHIGRVPSEQVLRDLDEGELSEILLIQDNAEYRGPSAPDVVQSTTSTLRIKPKDVDKGRLQTYVADLTAWASKQKYTEIQFRLKNLAGGATASPRFALEKNDAMETLYSRSQRLTGFGVLLQQCYAASCPQIEKKLVALIADDKGW